MTLPLVVSHDDDKDDPSRWAADEPTAMWDEASMSEAGYKDLAKHRVERPRAETGPATERGVKGELASKVNVSSELTGGHAAQPAAAPSSNVLSWVITGVLAIGLAVAAYFAVRFLR